MKTKMDEQTPRVAEDLEVGTLRAQRIELRHPNGGKIEISFDDAGSPGIALSSPDGEQSIGLQLDATRNWQPEIDLWDWSAGVHIEIQRVNGAPIPKVEVARHDHASKAFMSLGDNGSPSVVLAHSGHVVVDLCAEAERGGMPSLTMDTPAQGAGASIRLGLAEQGRPELVFFDETFRKCMELGGASR